MAAPTLTPEQGLAIASALYEILDQDHAFVVLLVNDDGEVAQVSSVPPHAIKALIDTLASTWSPVEVDNARTGGLH